MAQLVGVDCLGAKAREGLEHGALPGRDAAGKTDNERPRHRLLYTDAIPRESLGFVLLGYILLLGLCFESGRDYL